jgi:hypothetical protein
MVAKPAATRRARIASAKRYSNAYDAVIARRQTNMPHATSFGLDWPTTRTPREKKPVASAAGEVTEAFRKKLDEATVGDNIGVLLKSVERSQLNRGDVLTSSTQVF